MKTQHQKTNEILKWFEELSKIPRQSRNEEAIGNWLMKWASDYTFDGRQDSAGNVLIKIPASPGYEEHPVVVIQGHMDMVCEKTKDSTHDFAKDPIKLVYDGEWLKADRTTLGADNGIAIAMGMVAALDEEVKHPPLELLFTVDEETGLTGAKALEPGFIEARTLINLDSEDEGILTIGCSGGVKSDHYIPMEFDSLPGDYIPVTLKAGDMSGGHSADIHHEKANAVKVMARTLETLRREMPLRVFDIKGGTADNAIPRDVEAVICIPSEKREIPEKIINRWETIFKEEFKNTDPGLTLTCEIAENTAGDKAVTLEDSNKIIDVLLALPHGIWAMSTEVEHFVETSNNLASLQLESNRLKVVTSQRSPIDSRLDAVTEQIETVIGLVGGESERRSRYPGWQANLKSPVLEKSVAVFKELFGKEPVVETTHGGLECGVIGSKFPDMDMISFGPTIKFPHSPDEKIHIGTIGQVWDFFQALLKEL